MIGRNLWVLVIIMSIALPGFGQSEKEKKLAQQITNRGDLYYNAEKYDLAIDHYREALNYDLNNPEISYKIAESYRHIFNYPEAEVYYRKLYYNHPGAYPEVNYYYPLMLKYNARYDEAAELFNSFIENNKGQERHASLVKQAFTDLEGSLMALEDSYDADEYVKDLLPTPVNTSYNDYAADVSESNELVITSSRITSLKDRIDDRFGEAFSNIYHLQKVDQQWQIESNNLTKVVNTKYNDGSGSFNHDKSKYYYTICGFDATNCLIYVTQLKDDDWTAPSLLNESVNMPGYEAKQPSISYGGDTLYFVSNRPGGKGKNDIWMSIDSGNDEWGPAINLGEGINTPLNEISPRATLFSNTLFFSSEGHLGYGGLDLFMAKRLSSGDTVLFNLGAPFNSSRDDCFLTIAAEKIFWSSNRPGKGNFDIYSTDILDELSFISKIGLKKDISPDILSSRFRNASNSEFTVIRTADQLDYSNLSYRKKEIVDDLVAAGLDLEKFPLKSRWLALSQSEQDQLYQIAEKRYAGVISSDLYKVEVNANLLTSRSYITGFVKDSTERTISGIQVFLKDSADQILKIVFTDEDGRFKFTDLPREDKLNLKIDPLAYQRIKSGLKITDVSIEAYKENITYRPENIYFDFDHYVLRPEARKALENLALLLEKNPSAQVEIFAHADGQGSDSYNYLLTEKRGMAVYDFLVKQGIRAGNLAIKARGKDEPVASNDNAMGRQLNRRVEFYFHGLQDKYSSNLKTYLLQKKMELKDLAKKLDISAEDLATMNGLDEEATLKKFQPIRVRGDILVDEDLLFRFQQ